MGSFTSSPIAMLIVSVMLGTMGQFLMKKGQMVASHAKDVAGSAAFIAAIKSIGSPLVFMGFVCYGLSSILWMMILKKAPLSIAYPMISISYVLVVLLSPKILGEQVRWNVALPGLLLICAGVTMIGLGMAKH